MKNQSIRKLLLKLALILSGIFLVSQITQLFCFYLLFGNLQDTVNQQNRYISYERSAAALQDRVTEYFDNPSENTLSALVESKQVLLDLSAQMYTFFQSPQFADTGRIEAAWLSKIRELTDTRTQVEGNFFAVYRQCSHLYDLLIKQYGTTLPFEMAELSSRLDLLFTNGNICNIFILLLVFVLFLIIIHCTLNSIQKIVEPLSLLSEHARAFEQGTSHNETESLLHKANYTEIYILTSAFIHMEHTILEQISALKDKLKLSQKVHQLELENMSVQMALAQTENSLMQSLVNPHFLFNCLNLLSSFAIMEKAPNVHKYLLQIAQYLRESLDYNGKTITLEKEFLFIRHYADIQQLRFGSRIQFEFSCEKACENALIPAIILQPLVENALVHGVGSYLQDGRISVHARLHEEDKLLITVENNGNGMDDEELQMLRDSLQTPFQPGQKGTGIRSVLYRLNYYFDQAASLSIDSTPEYTTIFIVIPYRTQ